MPFTRINSAIPVLLCCACLLATGCEEIVDDPGALPYEEKLVIRSIVHAGKEMDSISITRTLPPLDEYNEEKAWVRGARVIVSHNGISDTLPDRGRGLYYKPGILPQPGEVYELQVEWGNLRATAVTRVPQYPTILSAYRTTGTTRWDEPVDILGANIDPNPGEVYSLTYDYKRPDFPYPVRGSVVEAVFQLADTNEAGVLPVQAESYYYIYHDNVEYTVYVQSYDEAFYAYFTSYHEDSDELFEQDRKNVKWNIRGDGIGMFIGIATSPPYEVQ